MIANENELHKKHEKIYVIISSYLHSSYFLRWIFLDFGCEQNLTVGSSIGCICSNYSQKVIQKITKSLKLGHPVQGEQFFVYR